MLKREDILHREKLSLLLFMKHRKYLTVAESGGKVKNTRDSDDFRNAGNELYRKRPHSRIIHEEIWCKYTQSIAYAPNNSEELAKGYGNRSALFFHLKKYKECIIDVDTALNITCSNLLKVKLLCRKADCLMTLNESTKSVCEEALQILEQLQVSEDTKKLYKQKLHLSLVNKNITATSDIKLLRQDDIIKDLLNFERSKEIPSVSKSVAIEYNEKYGRHVIATEDIKPGEIISVQKYGLIYMIPNKRMLYCSYCTIMAYNSLPCEFCVYSIYCSEECRYKSWEESHQYECVIYQHSIVCNEPILFTKFVLSVIHQVGSIEQMKDHILDIENATDPRTKGFSNGIFDTDQKKILYSLYRNCIPISLLYKETYNWTVEICNYVYILTKFTNFFGPITNVQESNLFLNEDMLFVAALILRTGYIFKENCRILETLLSKSNGGALQLHRPLEQNYYVDFFCSLINYRCFNNVQTVTTYGGENIIYANHPIRKGSQLFLHYNNLHHMIPTRQRKELLKFSEITCECIACTENWSTISMPTLEQMLQITPTLDLSLIKMNRTLLNQINWKNGLNWNSKYRFSIFQKDLLNKVCQHMIELAEKITINCSDYIRFFIFLEEFMHIIFSEHFYDMPEQCE